MSQIHANFFLLLTVKFILSLYFLSTVTILGMKTDVTDLIFMERKIIISFSFASKKKKNFTEKFIEFRFILA